MFLFLIFFTICIVKSASPHDYFIHWFDDQYQEIYDKAISIEVENNPIPEFCMNGSLHRLKRKMRQNPIKN